MLIILQTIGILIPSKLNLESYAKKMTKIFSYWDILDFLSLILYFYIQIVFTNINLDLLDHFHWQNGYFSSNFWTYLDLRLKFTRYSPKFPHFSINAQRPPKITKTKFFTTNFEKYESENSKTHWFFWKLVNFWWFGGLNLLDNFKKS